jgi:AcrR family transcriptional regulator
MPRVSDDHLAARRQQILDAARECFLRKGLHDTSMQDLIAEAGLSVGAVYRYFPSKADIIAAIADEVIGKLATVFEELTERHPAFTLPALIDTALGIVERELGPQGAFRLGLQVWAESTLDPHLAGLIMNRYAVVRTKFAAVAERARDRGELPADADSDAVAAVMFGSVIGFAVQNVLTGTPDRETYVAGLAAVLRGDAGR